MLDFLMFNGYNIFVTYGSGYSVKETVTNDLPDETRNTEKAGRKNLGKFEVVFGFPFLLL